MRRAGRVGAVGGDGDQADVAVRLAAALVVGADGQQARVLALRAGVRLQRHRGEAGDLGQPGLELRGTAPRSPAPARRARTGAAAPNSGQVTGSISAVALSFIVQEPSGIIEVVERQVPRLEPAHVAQHLVLGVVLVEDGMGEERARARERRRQPRRSAVRRPARPPRTASGRPRTRPADRARRRRSTVSSSAIADRAVGVGAQVDAARARAAASTRGGAAAGPGARAGCRRTARRRRRGPARRSPARQQRGQRVHAARRCAAALPARGRPRTCTPSPPAAPAPCRCCSWPCRAGCAARASAAPGGRRAGPRRRCDTPTMRPGHLALVLVARGEEGGVRPAEAQRHAEALGGARPRCPRRTRPAARSSVSASRSAATTTSAPAACARSASAGVVAHAPVGRRVLHQHAEQRARPPKSTSSAGPTRTLDAERLRARAHHGDGLRVAVLGHEERLARAPRASGAAHVHRLGRGGGLVEQRRVGQRQAGEVGHHRLEVEQRLQPALRDLRLVRRVLRVPARVLEDVALDDRRRDAVVVAHAEVRAEHLVRARPAPRSSASSSCSPRRGGQGERAAQADVRGHRRRRSARRARRSRARPASAAISASLGADVARRETVGGLEAAPRRAGRRPPRRRSPPLLRLALHERR